VPQYDPLAVIAQPGAGAVFAPSLLSFGAGIPLGAWMFNPSPWGWGGWGWNWGGRRMIVHNNIWVVNNRYRPRYRSYFFRPPAFNRPIYVSPAQQLA